MSKILSCKIKRQDEEFVVKALENGKQATVTDEKGTVVTISYESGHFNVRLPNGWGSWTATMEQSVERAVRLCIEARTQLTEDNVAEEIVGYIKKCG